MVSIGNDIDKMKEMIDSLPESDLIKLNRYIVGKVHEYRSRRDLDKLMSLNVGDIVHFAGKVGVETGRISKINQKTVSVVVEGVVWRVSPSLLKKCEGHKRGEKINSDECIEAEYEVVS